MMHDEGDEYLVLHHICKKRIRFCFVHFVALGFLVLNTLIFVVTRRMRSLVISSQ